MAAVVSGADPQARVPTCPEWSVAELAQHTGRIHRWAAAMVTDAAPERLDASTLDLGLPADERNYGDWLAAGADVLAAAFAATDPDASMWAWGADQHARFWSRRMLHETTIHRVDAQLACGADPQVDGAVAADGIDELLENLPTARYFRPRVAELRGDDETIALRSIDRADGWLIHLGPGRFSWSHDVDRDATVVASAPASDLLMLMYARLPLGDERVALTGDVSVLERWLDRSAL